MVNITGAIVTGIDTVMEEPNTPLWMKFLAVFGAIYVFQSMGKATGGIITFITYVIAFIKYVYDKIKE